MFVDDDFLWTKDIAELLNMVDDTKAIMCVQHDYKPTVTEKLAGRCAPSLLLLRGDEFFWRSVFSRIGSRQKARSRPDRLNAC
jgi:hypothetical protein